MKSLEEERLRALEAAARARAEVWSSTVVWTRGLTLSSSFITMSIAIILPSLSHLADLGARAVREQEETAVAVQAVGEDERGALSSCDSLILAYTMRTLDCYSAWRLHWSVRLLGGCVGSFHCMGPPPHTAWGPLS